MNEKKNNRVKNDRVKYQVKQKLEYQICTPSHVQVQP